MQRRRLSFLLVLCAAVVFSLCLCFSVFQDFVCLCVCQNPFLNFGGESQGQRPRETADRNSPKKVGQRVKQIRDAKRVKEQRHQPRLVEEEDYLTEGYCNEAALVTDVQIFDKLYEDAPSDLRHLFWSACSKRKTNPFENFREAWFEMNAIHDSMYSNHSTSSSHVTPVASPSQNNGLAHDRWKTEEKKFTDVSENPTIAAAAPTGECCPSSKRFSSLRIEA